MTPSHTQSTPVVLIQQQLHREPEAGCGMKHVKDVTDVIIKESTSCLTSHILIVPKQNGALWYCNGFTRLQNLTSILHCDWLRSSGSATIQKKDSRVPRNQSKHLTKVWRSEGQSGDQWCSYSVELEADLSEQLDEHLVRRVLWLFFHLPECFFFLSHYSNIPTIRVNYELMTLFILLFCWTLRNIVS